VKIRSVLAMVLACAFMAGCADLKEDIRHARDFLRKLRGKDPAPKPPAPPPAAQIPAPAAAGMNLLGNCIGKDESGYAENVRIDVSDGEVRQLELRIDIPGRGNCRFQLADFYQAKRTPFVELLGRANASCAVRMWQQGDRITVAATECPERCTRGSFEYLWPIELNVAGGCY
jgi:hypothetical protein